MTRAEEFGEIFDFIGTSLPTKLTTDQKKLKIVSEGDLQSCTYYHLRIFFKKRKFTKWYIQNQLSMGGKKTAKKYPDIVISRMKEKKPRGNKAGILIELKETRNFKEDVAENEIKKLVKMMNTYDSSGVFLYACLDRRKGKRVKQTNKIMEEMIPEGWKRWMVVKTINIKGKKTYDDEMDYFDEKVEILRKYRG